jgi:hypothetical protein
LSAALALHRCPARSLRGSREICLLWAFPGSRRGGLYFMGCPVHSVSAQPHKTAPQRRPKGSLSLTQMLRCSFSEFIILQHNKEYSIALFL